MQYGKRMARYLNQTVVWQRRTGKDAYNKPQYADAVDIPVRVEGKIRLVRDSLGNEVVSNTTAFCQSPVKALDLLGGKPVLTVADMVDGDGEVVGWEVYL